jgi:hypothetical protein
MLAMGLCRVCRRPTFSEIEMCPLHLIDCPKCGKVPNKPAIVDYAVSGYPVYCNWELHRYFYDGANGIS